jgi:hypothetical protein
MASKSTVDLGLRLFLMALRKHLIQLYNTRRSGNSGD